MSDYWLSTRSPPSMFRPDYQTPELAEQLRAATGVDPSVIAVEVGVCAPRVRAFQRKLGLRKITGNHRRKPKF